MSRDGTSKVPYVKKVGNAEDEASGDSFEIFRFRKTLDRVGKIRVDRDKARDLDFLFRLLLKKNADLPNEEVEAKKLISEAIEQCPPRFELHAKHVGWRPNRRGFVLKGDIVAPPAGKLRLRPPLWLNERQAGVLKTRGTIEDWRRLVAVPARYSTRLMLLISVAFAAPLLKVTGMPNFGVNIHGLSKVGKTTGLLGATSVIGIGSERNLPNWNATSGAFLETARTFNDLLLAVNEVSLLAGKKGDAYGPIRERIYTFSEGCDRARMSSSTMSSSGSSQYRGIFVSTAEHSFNAYAAFSGETRSEGEYARCLDVAATIKGKPTIFDHNPEGMDKKRARRWVRAQLVSLRCHCDRQHGTALRPYIEFLVAQGKDLGRKIRTHELEFMRRARELKLDGALEHAAKNFALIYAGGRLAIEAGILPWSRGALLDAIVSCFESAISDVRGHANALAVARRTLQNKLAGEEIIEKTRNASFGPMDHAGFFERENGKVRITVASAAFAKWFENKAQRLAALRWLHDQGLLDMGTKRASPSLRTTEWAERQRRWPDGSNPRSFVFFDPFGSKETAGT